MKNSCICGKCGHLFKDHQNLFGKFCTHCNHFNPPEDEMTIIQHNRIANEAIKTQLLDYLRKKYANPSK